jgi:D-glycero-alpha-D-manno-heptose-7-phosphate kinase
MNLLHYSPDGVTAEPLAPPLDAFARRLVIFSTQLTHHSGLNNWQVYKAAVDGDEKVLHALRRIATITHEMAAALAQEDFPEAGMLLSGEWAERKKLSPVVTAPAIDAMLHAALEAGAHGAKLCGAGGGGCGIALVPPERRAEIESALCAAGAAILPAQPTAVGFQVEIAGGQ